MQDKEKMQKDKENAIPASVNSILDELPEEKRNVILSTIMAIEERSFSGPLPPPDYFEAYQKTLPDSPNRILTMTEKQVDHRIDMEKTIVKKKFFQSTLGQVLATILILFFGYIAYDLALHDHDTAAIAIGVTTVVGLAVVFVLNKIPPIYPKNNTGNNQK